MEIEEVAPDTTCCYNCKWFDQRTRFCRLNPPVPLQINLAGSMIMTSVFPKINIPDVDYCSKFEKN